MQTLPGVNRDLAAAIRRVNAAYSRLPEPRPDVNTPAWKRLEDEIDRCCARGDRDSAIAAIERWERHALGVVAGNS